MAKRAAVRGLVVRNPIPGAEPLPVTKKTIRGDFSEFTPAVKKESKSKKSKKAKKGDSTTDQESSAED